MLPLIFEITAGPVPRGILSQCWERIERAYPGERGTARWEPHTPEGIQRVTLQVPERQPVYELLLGALTAIDYWSRAKWPFPSLLSEDSNVRYHPEPFGSEVWASTAAMFLRGVADCEDMACDLAAEYQLRGVPARAVLRLEEKTPTGNMWHVVVQMPDGSIQDPSAQLGMR